MTTFLYNLSMFLGQHWLVGIVLTLVLFEVLVSWDTGGGIRDVIATMLLMMSVFVIGGCTIAGLIGNPELANNPLNNDNDTVPFPISKTTSISDMGNIPVPAKVVSTKTASANLEKDNKQEVQSAVVQFENGQKITLSNTHSNADFVFANTKGNPDNPKTFSKSKNTKPLNIKNIKLDGVKFSELKKGERLQVMRTKYTVNPQVWDVNRDLVNKAVNKANHNSTLQLVLKKAN